MTAFKERIQVVNKINEIIEKVNAGLDPAEVLAIVRAELENYYTKEEVDDLIASIDFTPYYTKTEVDAIVSRIDGDVDALEGRMDTAEGDIDNLEQTKQDVMSAGEGIAIADETVSINNGWEPYTLPNNGVIDTDNYDYKFVHNSGYSTSLLLDGRDDLVLSKPGSYNTAVGNVQYTTGKKIKLKYISVINSTNPMTLGVMLLDGTPITSSNIDTYFDTTTKLPLQTVYVRVSAGLTFTALVFAGQTSVPAVGLSTSTSNYTMGYGIINLVDVYNFIKSSTSVSIRYAEISQISEETPVTSAYRRKR